METTIDTAHPYFQPQRMVLLDRFKDITGLSSKDIISYRMTNQHTIYVKIKPNREYRANTIQGYAAHYIFIYHNPTQWVLSAVDERSLTK